MGNPSQSLDLIVLPGLDGTGRMLEAFAQLAIPHFHSVEVVAYPHDQVWGYAELIEWTLAKLDQRQRPFVLLGESFSGPVALKLAAGSPKQLRALVLSTSFVRSPVEMPIIFKQLMAWCPNWYPPMFALNYLLLGRWASPFLTQHLIEVLKSVPFTVLRHRAQAAVSVDYSAHAQNIDCPILALWASADRLLSSKVEIHLQACISNLNVARIEGPHLLLQTHPGPSLDVILQFIDQQLP